MTTDIQLPTAAPEAPQAAPEDEGVPPAEGAPTEEQAQEQPKPNEAYERKWLSAQEQIKRQERELRKTAARLKEQESKLEKLSKLESMDELEYLEYRGTSYDDITKRILEGNQLTPEQREQMELKQQLEQLRKEREEEKQTAAQQREQQQREQHLSAIEKAFDEAGETFAYAHAFGFSGEFYNRLQNFATENGYAPSPEEQGEIALKLETEVRQAVNGNIEGLITRSPEFRKQVADLIAKLEPKQEEEPDQQAEQVDQRDRNGAVPTTITREHLSAVESRKEVSGMSLEEKRARGRERTAKRLGIG